MRTVLACAAVIAAMAPSAGAAAFERKTPSVVVEPDWVARPTGADMERFYPFAASTLLLEGRATISCAVEATGKLKDCTVLNESPEGIGFGKAAVKLSSLFRMRPMTVAGRSVDGGVVRIPIRFRLPPKPQPEVMPEASLEAIALAKRLTVPTSTRPDAATQAEMWVNSHRYRLIAELDAETAAKVTNAVRHGQEEAIPKAAELQARVIASTVPLDELRANADFWTSDMGRQISAKFETIKAEQSRTMYAGVVSLVETARQIFCKKRDCAQQADFATARAPKPTPGLVLKPDWVEKPDYAQTNNVYPIALRILGVGGDAALLCRQLQSGTPSECEVVAEAPAGLGFGAAALKLAPMFRLRMTDASPAESVWLPVSFKAIHFPPPPVKTEPASGPNLDLARQVVVMEVESRRSPGGVADLFKALTNLPASDGSVVEKEALKALMQAMRQQETSMSGPLVSLYAKTFDEAELRAYLAYQRTPAGRAWPAHQAKVGATMIKLGQTNLSAVFGNAARARFCSTHPCEIEPALPRPEPQ